MYYTVKLNNALSSLNKQYCAVSWNYQKIDISFLTIQFWLNKSCDGLVLLRAAGSA